MRPATRGRWRSHSVCASACCDVPLVLAHSDSQACKYFCYVKWIWTKLPHFTATPTFTDNFFSYSLGDDTPPHPSAVTNVTASIFGCNLDVVVLQLPEFILSASGCEVKGTKRERPWGLVHPLVVEPRLEHLARAQWRGGWSINYSTSPS